MDKRIFITLIAVIILIGAFIGIRVLLSNQCQPPEITMEPASPETGQIVKFSCNNNEDNISWNFGDGKSSSGATAEHLYDKTGTYNVTAKVNDDCSNVKEVIVREPRKIVAVLPVINMPSEIHAGEEIMFSETSSGAAVRKWTVKESNETGEGETFSTTFKSAGKYHLAVSLSGNYVTGDSTYVIEVLKAKPVVRTAPVVIPPKPQPISQPKPEQRQEPKPKPVQAPKPDDYLSEAEFIRKFDEIANALNPASAGFGEASDGWRDVILKQACQDQNLTIIVGGVQMSDEDFKRKLISQQISEVSVTKVLPPGDNKCRVKVIVSAKSR